MAKEQSNLDNGSEATQNLESALETLDTNQKAPEGEKQPEATQPEQGSNEPDSTSKLRTKEDEEKDNKALLDPQISDGSILKALRSAFTFGRKALHLEIAIVLAKFAADGSIEPNKATRTQIIRLYAQAGFDVQSSKGDDYKTIWRRMDAASELYKTITRPKIFGVMNGKTDAEALTALTEYLVKTYNFTGINSVFAAANKPVKQTNTKEYRAAKAEADATKSQPPMQPDTAQQPEAANEGVSTRAGGVPGDAQPQGHVAAGGTNEQGQPLTADGTIDKRVKTGDEPSLATQEARGEISKEEADKQAGKEPQAQPAKDASAEDKATAARMSENMQNGEGERRQGRRMSDSPNAIIFPVEQDGYIVLPNDISPKSVRGLAQQLLMFAQELEENAEEAKAKHSAAEVYKNNNRRNGTTRQQAAMH